MNDSRAVPTDRGSAVAAQEEGSQGWEVYIWGKGDEGQARKDGDGRAHTCGCHR